MSARRVLPALALLAALLAPVVARAATKIEGEYQLMLDLRKDQRFYPWNWQSNSSDQYNNAQLRIFSQPRSGVEWFLKTEAHWQPNDNNSLRPEFQYREAHLRFQKQLGKDRRIDSYLFSRQNRFWVDNYLIPFVNGRDGSQGVRVETWGLVPGSHATFIAADQSDQFNPASFSTDLPIDSVATQKAKRTDDMYVARVVHEYFKDHRLRLGFTYNRYESNQGDSLLHSTNHNEVVGFDSRYRVAGTDISVEYGQSRGADPSYQFGDDLHRQLTFFKQPTGLSLNDHAVLQAEVRSIRLGTPRIGYLAITPSYWTRGVLWQNYMGGPSRDETGFLFQSYYLVPERAITLTNNLRWYTNRATTRYGNRELYNEAYVEFINGFTGKTYYRTTDVYRVQGGFQTRDRYQDWFSELQVESRLAWLRVESKVISIGRPDTKQIFAIETRINLTNTLKLYERFGIGNDPSIQRKAVFTQLQYRPAGNIEMYLQYGPDYIGGSAVPVDEGNLQNGGDQADILKFIMKGNF